MSAGVTLTGTIQDVTGSPDAGKITVELVNFGNVVPRVAGSNVLAPIMVTSQANGSGVFSLSLYGQYQITPASTYYVVSLYGADGSTVSTAAYQFTTAGTFDLSNLVPLTIPSGTLPVASWVVSLFGRSGNVSIYPTDLASLQSISASGNITAPTALRAVVKATAGVSGITLTLPAASVWAQGFIDVIKVDSAVGVVTINGNGGANIDAYSSFLLTNQYDAVTLFSDGSSIFILNVKTA